jgi:alpha-L-fucosidase
MEWWWKARFGMFIHWGLYAIPGRGEWIMYQEHIPHDEYAELAQSFAPHDYHPEKWVALAQEAGMKYMVLTTRHHDGFCLFDSQVSDFTAPKSAAGRDLIAEFAEACHAAGMPLGFYYSLVDWRYPGVLPRSVDESPEVYEPMVEQAHAQVRELLSNYGEVDVLWYDVAYPPDIWRPEELDRMVRELQPKIIVNNRSGIAGDFGSPANEVIPESRPWEACFTMNDSWGHVPNDTNYKSPEQLLRLLMSCVARGGNFLLNVAPDPNGRIPAEAVERLQVIGAWLRRNGDAVYGAGPSPVVAPALGWSTRAGNKVYLLIQRWPGSTVPLAWCGSRVVSARVVSTGQEARVEQRGDRVWLHDLPEETPDPLLSVVELRFDGEPRMAEPGYV